MSNPRNKQSRKFTNLLGEDVEYVSSPFGAKHSISLLPKVMKLVGGPLGHLTDAIDTLEDVQSSKLNGQALVTAVTSLADFIEEEGMSFIESMLETTYRKGPEDDDFRQLKGAYFSEAYKANLSELARAVFFAIEVNYAGFLKKHLGDLSLMEFVQAKTQAKDESKEELNPSQKEAH